MSADRRSLPGMPTYEEAIDAAAAAVLAGRDELLDAWAEAARDVSDP